jgi:PAS domain S-box-containing protein
MIRTDHSSHTLERAAATLVVATLGVVSAGVFVARALEGAQPLVGRLLNAYSVLFSGILVVGAVHLLRGKSAPDRPLRVAGWCLAGVFLLFAVEWWLLLEHAMRDGADLRTSLATMQIHVPVIGGVAGLLLGFYDTTRLGQYETERQLRHRLASVLSASLVPIIVLDEEMRITRWNDAAERLFGWTEAEVLGRRPPMVPEAERATLDDIDERLDPDGRLADSVATRRTKGGERLEVRRSIARIRDDGDTVGYLVVVDDITETQRREQALERSRDLLARTQQLAAVGGWELDLRSDEIHWTDGTREIFQVPNGFVPSLEEAIEFFRTEDQNQLREALERCRQTGEPFDLELRIVTAEGSERWVESRGEAVTENGSVVKLRGTIQDITARKQREQHLAVLHRLFRHNLRNDLNIVIGRAETLLDALDAPDATGTPDRETATIRNRDTAVRRDGGEASSDTSSTVPAEVVREHTDAILDQSADLASTADKICQYDVTASNERRRTAVALRPLLEALGSQYRSQYPGARITLTCSDEAAVYGDPDHVDQVVDELLENALEHATDESPTVELSASTSADRVTLTVADTGPGLPDYERDVVTGGGETPLVHGSGVGLWLVDWLVTRLDGTLRFEDNEPRGTVAILELPAADPTGRVSGAPDDRQHGGTPSVPD